MRISFDLCLLGLDDNLTVSWRHMMSRCQVKIHLLRPTNQTHWNCYSSLVLLGNHRNGPFGGFQGNVPHWQGDGHLLVVLWMRGLVTAARVDGLFSYHTYCSFRVSLLF